MTRLLKLIAEYQRERGVSREQFIDELVLRGYGDRIMAQEAMSGRIDACVAMVRATREILGIADEEAEYLRVAGMEDAREALGLLQNV